MAISNYKNQKYPSLIMEIPKKSKVSLILKSNSSFFLYGALPGISGSEDITSLKCIN